MLAGAKSPPFDGDAMVRRVQEAIPNGHARLLPDAGHALGATHIDLCVAEIRAAIEAATSKSPR